jgi:hypothetical protein
LSSTLPIMPSILALSISCIFVAPCPHVPCIPGVSAPRRTGVLIPSRPCIHQGKLERWLTAKGRP